MARPTEVDYRPVRDPSGTLGAITVSDVTVLNPICCALIVSARRPS